MINQPLSKPQVALLSESLGPDSSGELTLQVLALFHSMNWQVLLVTGTEQEPHFSRLQERWPRTQILSPFSAWSLKELPRVMRLLFDYQPDILHSVCPQKGFSHPLLWLPSLSHPLWPHRSSCSLPHNLKLTRGLYRQRIQPLLHSCDVVWATHPEQENQLRIMKTHWWPTSSAPEIFFSPLTDFAVESSFATADFEQLPQWLEGLIQQNTALVFIPGSVGDAAQPMDMIDLLKKLQNQEGLALHFVFAQGWGPLSLREKAEIQTKLKRENLLHHWLTPLNLSFRQQMQLQSQCPFALSPQNQLLITPQTDRQSLSDGNCNQIMRILRNSPPNR